ncbi:NTP transferase domain-containing protein [Proteinivorax tanatarense]|uniref:NTP transferase domain-containing protein n=1 Tax=Proteinivorax tanatarense TaxID=1260629 RepID=A0AAU7VLM6_9FIRM
MQKIRAVILAGDDERGKCLNSNSKIHNKAFIKINDRYMVQYVLDAVCAVEGISDIVVVGPERPLKKLQSSYNFEIVKQQGDIVDNVIASINGWHGEKVLVVTSDIPMITPQAIRDFLLKTHSDEADIYYPIIDKESNEKMFPNAKRTYVKIKEGTYTGGNIALINTECVIKCKKMGKKLVSMRKSPLKLARLLGFKFLIKLMANNLTILELENKLSLLLDSNVKAIQSTYPQLGTDIDKKEDVKIAEKSLTDLKISN